MLQNAFEKFRKWANRVALFPLSIGQVGCYCKCLKSTQNGVISIKSSLYTDVLSEYSRKRGRLSGPFPIVSC